MKIATCDLQKKEKRDENTYLEIFLVVLVLEGAILQFVHARLESFQQTDDLGFLGVRVEDRRVLDLLFNLLYLLNKLRDVLVQMRAELVDVGIAFCQRFVDGIANICYGGIHGLES